MCKSESCSSTAFEKNWLLFVVYAKTTWYHYLHIMWHSSLFVVISILMATPFWVNQVKMVFTLLDFASSILHIKVHTSSRDANGSTPVNGKKKRNIGELTWANESFLCHFISPSLPIWSREYFYRHFFSHGMKKQCFVREML